jgi:branched-chain amino acid aminotransferase
MPTVVVNVNGRIADGREATIPVFDHGFLYGEGVYETLRTYNTRPFLFDRHMRRLRKSAEMIRLDVPLGDRDMADRVDATVAAAAPAWPPATEAYIRILLTRGVGELTYDPAACPTPSLVVIVKPLPIVPAAHFEQGVGVSLVDIVRNHPESVNPLIKSNNLLNNALAMQEALRRGSYEAVMRNYRGELTECTQSNLFIVRSGAALTPPLEAGLLAGITREFLFEIGGEVGVEVREAVLVDNDLFQADEAFMSGTTRELLPIVQVDGRVIGSGVPGPVTGRLLHAFRRRALELSVGAREAGYRPA